MYYYIFEPPQGPKDFERNAQIKELVSSLGIAGEMSTPTTGKGVEELVNQAIAKRYSTIVAVGGMALINQTARALEPYDVVLGIIPTVEHSDIAQLIGVSDWKSAAEQLKRRRFHLFHQGAINSQIHFLTPATVSIPGNSEYEIISERYQVKGKGGEIKITPAYTDTDSSTGSIKNGYSNLIIEILPKQQRKSKSFWKGFFNKSNPEILKSRFSVDSFSLSTEAGLPVSVAGSVLCTTPINCSTKSKEIKIIVGKGVSSKS